MYRENESWMEKYQISMEQAKRYFRFCAKMYKHKREQGRLFLHEHPWLATSWTLDATGKLSAHEELQKVQTHMCQFGMLGRIGGVGSELGPLLKPTGFLTNSPCIARGLSRVCPRDHEHAPLVGGRAADATIYPEKLCIAICKGLSDQKRGERTRMIKTFPMTACRLSSLSLLCCEATGGYPPGIVTDGKLSLDNIQIEIDGEGWHRGEFRKVRPIGSTKPPGDRPSHWSDMIHEFNGHGMDVPGEYRSVDDIMADQLSAPYALHGVEMASDNVTGAWLDPILVHKGCAAEMECFNDMGLYVCIPSSKQPETGGKIIGTKWIDLNKGGFP